MAFVSVFSPLIRRFPRTLVAAAGRTAWLAIPISVLPVLLGLLTMWLLFRNKAPGTGLAGLLTDVFGGVLGRIIVGVYALWLIFYTGFLMRSGAARFISTVYQGASPWIFVISASLIGGFVALGELKAIARSAMLLRPMLMAVLALLVILAVKDVDFRLLLPATVSELPGDGYAALKLANLLSVAGYFAFLGDRMEGRFRLRDYAGWLAAVLVIIGLMTAVCLGMFGPELTAKMTYPFFMLARDVTILGSMERVEPVIIALWIFSDFIFLSALFSIAARNLRFCLAFSEPDAPPKLTDLRNGRWLMLPCAALVVAAAALIPGEVPAFERFSEVVVPAGNAVMIVAVPLLTLLVGKLRRRI